MNVKHYRKLRILVGAATLVFCAMAFSDVPGWISSKAVNIGLWPQFTPSVLRLMHGFSWMAAGAIAVLLLTALFGRVYCAMLCPLGVLMDLSAWLAGRTGKKRLLHFQTGSHWPRATVVAISAGGLLAGTALPLAFLDPYSIFGKITASTLRPIFGWMNHGLAAIGVGSPAEVSPTSWVAAGVALTLLALVVVAAVFRGRLWCNTVCPVGAVLGVISRHSLFRLTLSESACVACSLCERACPAQCIDYRNHRIDHSRCVMCLNCVTSCKRTGILLNMLSPLKFGKALGKPAVPTTPPSVSTPSAPSSHTLPATSRRLFLASAIALPTVALAESHERKGEHGNGHGEGHGKGEGHGQGKGCKSGLTQHNKRPVLPPGAISLEHFQSLCTACHLCVANCPDQVLRPSISQHGLAGFLQPFQDFEVSFCSYNCSNCSKVCPTGAIQRLTVPERRLVRTGVAEFFRGRCIVKTDGTACGACSEHCPTQAVHMVPWKDGLTIPEVDPDLCIGCGGCEFICPARPNKAIIVNGLMVHEKAKPVQRGEKNVERKMEAEFPF